MSSKLLKDLFLGGDEIVTIRIDFFTNRDESLRIITKHSKNIITNCNKS